MFKTFVVIHPHALVAKMVRSRNQDAVTWSKNLKGKCGICDCAPGLFQIAAIRKNFRFRSYIASSSASLSSSTSSPLSWETSCGDFW